MHRDVRSPNILISPSRIATIDFGEAILRKEGVSDDEWNAQVRTEDEVEAVRIILNNRHIRGRTPFDIRISQGRFVNIRNDGKGGGTIRYLKLKANTRMS